MYQHPNRARLLVEGCWTLSQVEPLVTCWRVLVYIYIYIHTLPKTHVDPDVLTPPVSDGFPLPGSGVYSGSGSTLHRCWKTSAICQVSKCRSIPEAYPKRGGPHRGTDQARAVTSRLDATKRTWQYSKRNTYPRHDPWDCHICRSVGVVPWGSGWGGIYGSPMKCLGMENTSELHP